MVWRWLRRPFIIYGLIVIVLFWFVWQQISVGEILLIFGRLQLHQILILILLNGLVLITLVVRWRLLLEAVGYPLPFMSLFAYRLAAFGVTYFTPGPQFGGEPLQVYLIKAYHGVPINSAVATVTMDKVLELVANFGFLVGGTLLLLGQRTIPTQLGYQTLAIALLLLAFPLALFLAFIQGKQPLSRLLDICWSRLTLGSRQARLGWFSRMMKVVAAGEQQVVLLCQSHPGKVGWAFFITIIGWGLMVFEFAYAARLLGTVFTATEVVMVLMAARIAYLLPMPAGLGTFETSLVFAYQFLHFDPTAGLALSLLIRTRDIFLGLLGLWLGGATFLFRGQSDPDKR